MQLYDSLVNKQDKLSVIGLGCGSSDAIQCEEVDGDWL